MFPMKKFCKNFFPYDTDSFLILTDFEVLKVAILGNGVAKF